MSKTKYLVTGASGFLGRHLLTQLSQLETNPTLIPLVRDLQTWEDQDWAREIPAQPILGEVTQPDWHSDDKLSGLSGIFHLAAQVVHSRSNPAHMLETNIQGTLQMVHLAARYKTRLIFVSTSGTVGCSKDSRQSADESAPYATETVGRWPYYSSKIQAEEAARHLAKQLGVELIIVRPPVMLGPGDHRFRSTHNIMKLLKGRLPFLIKGGIHYVDVRDVAGALIQAMTIKKPREIYHLPGTACSLDEFFSQVADEARIAAKWRHVPPRALWAASQLNQKLRLRIPIFPDPVVVEMGQHYWGLSSRYSKEDLAFKNRPHRQTLHDTVAWLREHGEGH